MARLHYSSAGGSVDTARIAMQIQSARGDATEIIIIVTFLFQVAAAAGEV